VIIEKFPESSEFVEIFLSILNPTIIKRKDYASKLNEYSTVRDKNDRHILAAATIGKVDYIVTGDADLLCLKNYNNISIVQARKIVSLPKKTTKSSKYCYSISIFFLSAIVVFGKNRVKKQQA